MDPGAGMTKMMARPAEKRCRPDLATNVTRRRNLPVGLVMAAPFPRQRRQNTMSMADKLRDEASLLSIWCHSMKISGLIIGRLLPSSYAPGVEKLLNRIACANEARASAPTAAA